MIWDRITRRYRTERARRDPLSIGVSVLVNLGITGVGSLAIPLATAVGYAALAAASIGLSLLSNAIFSPSPQTNPSERQATVRQTVGPRIRNYGRVKTGGTMWFFESRDGALYSGIVFNEGQISNIVELWFNDAQVTYSLVDGAITSEPYVEGGGSYAYIYFRMGTSDQTVLPVLTGAFPGVVTADHRLRGAAHCVVQFYEVPAERISEIYPNYNPSVRVVFDASLVKNVRTGAVGWSDNPWDCIYDYLTGRDGAGFAYGAGYAESRIDLASFQAQAALADENVPLKDGSGNIARYRLWGGYALNEPMKNTLQRMLATCDGDIYINSAGKIAARGGTWVEPVLTFEEQHIIRAEFRRGAQALAAFNELTITYVEPALDFQEVEADVWVDAENLALRGRPLSRQLDLPMVPSHPRARRLGKIHTKKNNPAWSGKIITNFYGFNAINEQTCRIRWPVLGIDTTFLIRKVSILADLTGVEVTVSSLSASAYDWDAELEEGTAPNAGADTSSPISLPPPDDFDVFAEPLDAGYRIVATWTEPDRTALSQQVQYRLSPAGDWFNMSIADGSVGRAETGLVTTGEDYDVRIRTLAPAGTPGPWIDPVITVNASV